MTQIYYPFDTGLVSEWPGTRPPGWGYHVGTDFAVASGTPVPATASGTIAFVGDDGLGGFTIDIVDDDGVTHRFGHLTWGTARVVPGQRVSPGQILALSGNSGMSTGPHLHWELRRDRAWSGGNWIDPRKAGVKTLSSHGSAGKPKPSAKDTIDHDESDEDMKNSGFYYTNKQGMIVYLIVNYATGTYHEYSSGEKGKGMPGNYNNGVAAAFGTGSFAKISASHAGVIKSACDNTRQGK